MSSGKSHEVEKKEFTLINYLGCLSSWGLWGIWKGQSLHILSPSSPQGISASLPLSAIGALSPPPSFPAPFALQGSCSRLSTKLFCVSSLPYGRALIPPPTHSQANREETPWMCKRCFPEQQGLLARQLKGAKDSCWTVLLFSSPFFATPAELPNILNLQIKIFFFFRGSLRIGR